MIPVSVDTSQKVSRFSRDTFCYARNRVTSVTVGEAVSIYSQNCSCGHYYVSIKRDPRLSGHFHTPRTILNANAPVLSTRLSNTSNGWQILSHIAQKLALSGHFERPDLFASQLPTPVINFGAVLVFCWKDQVRGNLVRFANQVCRLALIFFYINITCKSRYQLKTLHKSPSENQVNQGQFARFIVVFFISLPTSWINQTDQLGWCL